MMKKTIIFLLIILVVCTGGCWPKPKTSTDSTVATPFSIANMDSVVFNDSIFFLYSHSIPTPGEVPDNQLFFYHGSDDEVAYQSQHFIPEHDDDLSSAEFLLDSIPLSDGVYALLFANRVFNTTNVSSAYSDDQCWLVTYSTGRKYIDSRLIYRNAMIGEREYQIYSYLKLSNREFTIYDRDYGEIPVAIHADGRFEEYPDEPFSTANIAVTNCNSNGLYGKFPMNETWTLLSFAGQLICREETKQNYVDVIGNISTLFGSPLDKDFSADFGIALRGTYEDNELAFMPPLTKEGSTAEIDSLIRQNLSDSIASHYDGYNADSVSNEVYSFTHNGKVFRMVYHKFRPTRELPSNDEYATMIGIAPNGNMILLVYDALHEEQYGGFRILRVKNDYLLLLQGHSYGEGATLTAYVYKLTTEFKKLFKETIFCD